MGSELAKAKGDVEPSLNDTSEPEELSLALDSAHALRHELAKKKEEYRHVEIMKDKEIAEKAAGASRDLGAFGRYFGGPSSAPLAIASIAVLGGC